MKLNKLAFVLAIVIMSAFGMSAGEPPTVMFLPDITWCNANNYVTTSERNGKTKVSENYETAFFDEALKDVVTQLNTLMGDNGIKPKTYRETAEADDEEEAEEDAYDNDDEDGGNEQLSDYELMMQKLRPDIIIKLGWTKAVKGLSFDGTWRLEAIDSYSNKSIAGVTGNIPLTRGTDNVALARAFKAAATEKMAEFLPRLREHFDDIQENGREITLTLRIGKGSGVNFDSDFDGKLLPEIIDEWLGQNTVNHSFSLRSGTKSKMQFEQVRIPFKDGNNSNNAQKFVLKLKKYLQNTYALKSKDRTKGQGTGRLYNISD